MSEYRQVHRSFWESETVEQMDPSEKLLYIYLIAGPKSNMEGLYKVSLRRMSLETGLDKDMIVQLCTRLEDKRVAGFRSGWVCVVQATQHMPKSPQMMAHAKGLYCSIPSAIHDWATDLGYLYATDYDVTEEDRTVRCVGDAKKRRILARDDHRCVNCGGVDSLVIHHVVRLADGGSNEDKNLATLCQDCHAEIHRGDWKKTGVSVQYGILQDKTKQNKKQDETQVDTVLKQLPWKRSGAK